MSKIDYLDGCIYHMVHFENLPNIFQRRALLSKERTIQEKIPYRSIAYEEVQSLRDRIFVRDLIEQRNRGLHSYVPFYFAIRTPMLHVQYRNRLQNEIIILEVNRSILKDLGVLFTDGNASNQQLAKYGAEKVLIIPATVLNDSCHRNYFPGGPYGTNPHCSNFYGDADLLDRLDWDGINGRRYIDPLDEYVRVRLAEVLVPDVLPLGRVQGIYVSTQNMVHLVNAVIEGSGLAGRIPLAMWKPSLYF